MLRRICLITTEIRGLRKGRSNAVAMRMLLPLASMLLLLPVAQAQIPDVEPPERLNASEQLQELPQLAEPADVKLRRFQVAKVRTRLGNEAGLGAKEQDEWIQRHVKTVCGIDGREANNIVAVKFSSGLSANLKLSDRGEGCLLSGSELIVVASQEDLENLAQSLRTLNELGVRQILIRTHVFRGDAEEIKKLPIGWSFVESVSTVAREQTEKVRSASTVASPLPHPVVSASTESATAVYLKRQQQKQQVAESMAPPAGVTGSTWTEASSIIERSTPVFYTLLTPVESARVVEQAGKNDDVQRVMSPVVVVFNGHSAKVNDTVERPFVTGVRPMQIESDKPNEIQFAPNIRVYPEGTTMELLPELVDGKSIRLNYRLNLCKIQKVETLTIPKADLKGEFAIQMPEVASTKFHTCLDMPLNYALAVSTTDTLADGEKVSTLVVCQCSVRNIDGSLPQ